ncbi:hypothetical protein AAHN97_21170 [Chitinophaga niabensis]|uniref:hypothetical protein n=1 Tax=Chitinophaga niabensis TaxID=536979 RepID=UPI0031BAFB7D
MKYLMILAGFCLAACNNSPAPAIVKDSTVILADDTVIKTLTNQVEIIAADTATRINFPEFKIVLAPLAASSEGEIENDTVYCVAAPGEAIEEARIYITSSQLTDIKVEEQAQTRLSISWEESYYEFSEWKYGYTGWEELLMNEDSAYVTRSYSLEELSVFPEVTMEEVKAAIDGAEKDAWLEIIKNAKTIRDEPFEIFGDTFLLRVSGKRKDDGRTVTKIIIIQLASGC